jgi:hypothetical protein
MTKEDIKVRILKKFPLAKNIKVEQLGMVSGGIYTTVSFNISDCFSDYKNYTFDYVGTLLVEVNGINLFEIDKAEDALR